MRGEHDDQLQWPFEGGVIVELLNWRDDKGHCEKILDLNQGTDKEICACVIKRETGIWWGYPYFISHSSLSYNPTTNSEYLQDDCGADSLPSYKQPAGNILLLKYYSIHSNCTTDTLYGDTRE